MRFKNFSNNSEKKMYIYINNEVCYEAFIINFLLDFVLLSF